MSDAMSDAAHIDDTMTDVRLLDAVRVRHRIASSILEPASVPPTVGGVTLHDHQRAVAARALGRLEQHGGVLVAEPVGRGKTFIALAVAARIAQPTTLVIPAALRGMWSEALAACGITATIITHEGLSTGRSNRAADGLIVVDEAHRFRNASTRRYSGLAELCRHARVLLLTATPIQNRRDDLAAQIAIFLGRRAWTMDNEALSAHVLRASAAPSTPLPRQRGPIAVPLDVDDDCLGRILSLPPPVPAHGESIAETLLVYGLVHQWTSSRAALTEALRRRRTRGLAMLAALDSGRAPTRAELGAWTHAGDAIQLAFPELVATEHASDAEIGDLAAAISRHLTAIDALLRHCRGTPDPDEARAAALLRIRVEHPGERILAFAHYAETVRGLHRYLAHAGRVATLSARGVAIAAGRMRRADVLAQFVPHDHRRAIPESERIDLLVTTDLLSEGMNLQEASVAVHLDLPWNPARLEQRVGRIRRLGSRHQCVTIYSIAPPASAESLLRIETRLRDKLRIAQRTIGIAGSILPSPLPALGARGLAELHGELHERLSRWRRADIRGDPVTEGVVVAAVRSPIAGCIAAIGDGRRDAYVVVVRNDDVSARIEDVLSTLRLAEDDDDVVVDPKLLRCTLERMARFIDQRRGSSAIDLGAVSATRARRAVLARVTRALARAPRHRRARIVDLADAARLAATLSLGEGAERILDVLVRADLPDEAWLRSVAAFGELHRRDPSGGPASPARPIAVLLLQPETR
jgi:superfamily II DNA or RNA helicase